MKVGWQTPNPTVKGDVGWQSPSKMMLVFFGRQQTQEYDCQIIMVGKALPVKGDAEHHECWLATPNPTVKGDVGWQSPSPYKE